MLKKNKFPLPKGTLNFLRMFKESESYIKVPPGSRGIITQSIGRRGILNNKHLKLIQKAVAYKGIKDILDASDPRLKYYPTNRKKVVANSKKKIDKTISDYPFDIHWKPKKGNTQKKK